MPSRRSRGLLAALLGLIGFGAIVAWFGIEKPHRQEDQPPPAVAAVPPGDHGLTQADPEQAANQSPPVQTPANPEGPDGKRDQAKASAASTGPAAAAPPAEAGKPGGPSFDVVRVEPNGDSVIAGRGVPGATIEMSRNGKSHARAIADASGLFAFVPPPLRPGSHEIVISSIAPDGTRAHSRDSVTVVINEDLTTKPLVTLTSPDRPTVVLSTPEPSSAKSAGAGEALDALGAAPESPQQAAGPRPGIKIGSVEAEEGGRLFVSGSAAAGATVRLYLNESFIAPGGTGSDGKVSFAIGRGVRPGDYRVRLDDVDPVSGHVKSRAEVGFVVPPPLTVPLPPQAPPLVPGSDLPGATVAGHPGAGIAGSPGSSPTREATAADRSTAVAGRASDATTGGQARSMDPGTIVVPEINTTVVARGDNLWSMSRRLYGQGTRYTVIYDANHAQIRNPDRIYPGQMFVVPSEQRPTKAR